MTTETSPAGGDETTSDGRGDPVQATAAEGLAALLAAREPARPALIVPDSGHVMTYAEVTGQIEALAQSLAGLGVQRGDKVALCLPNGPDVVLLLLAVTMLGAAAAPPAGTSSSRGSMSPR